MLNQVSHVRLASVQNYSIYLRSASSVWQKWVERVLYTIFPGVMVHLTDQRHQIFPGCDNNTPKWRFKAVVFQDIFDMKVLLRCIKSVVICSLDSSEQTPAELPKLRLPECLSRFDTLVEH